ncbi:MAG: WD40 repeat domain-containing protein [Planctomycetota bacterium]
MKATLMKQRDVYLTVVCSRDGRFLAAATEGEDATAVIWETSGNRIVASTGVPAGRRHIDFSPDSRLFAAGTADGIVRLIDTATWRDSMRFRAHTRKVVGVRFSPDGSVLATSDDTGEIQLWDLSK